ncbi:MAG: DUF3592 domain-containing protein [Lachnospiraceae bacterium]
MKINHIVLCSISALMIFFGSMVLYEYHQKGFDSYVTTTAVVEQVKREPYDGYNYKNHEKMKKLTIVYRYRDNNGNTYYMTRKKNNSGETHDKVGDKITVSYNPGNPNEVTTGTPEGSIRGAVIFISGGVLLLAFVVVKIVGAKKKPKRKSDR